MRDLAPRILEYLDEKGVDSTVFITVIAAFFLWWTIRGLRNWDNLMYYEKWMVVVELLASALVALVGFGLLLNRLL